MKTKQYIGEAFLLSSILTPLLAVATTTFTDGKFNAIETAAVFFSFACTWLCTRQVRFNYVLGVISTSLLCITFAQAHLYGSMALNLYLIPTVIYGWFIWGRDQSTMPVHHVKLRTIPIYLLVTAVTWYGAYTVVNLAGGQMAYLDGWLLVGSVLAQYLLDRKKLENWLIWIGVNVVSIYVYIDAGLYVLAGQFALFIINALIAYVQWKRSMGPAESAPTPVTLAVA